MGRRSSIMSYDYSVWPYCSPDFDNSQFVLSIATLLRGQDDWELWYYAFIPLVIMIIATVLVMVFNYGSREDFVIDDDEPAPKPKPVVQAPVPVPVPEPVPEPVPVPVVPEPVDEQEEQL